MSENLHKTLAKSSFTVTAVNDNIRASVSTPNFLITCSSDLATYNYSNAKSQASISIGDKQIPAKYIKLGVQTSNGIVYPNAETHLVTLTRSMEVNGTNVPVQYILKLEQGLISIISFTTGLTKADLISGSFDVVVSLTDEAKALEDYSEFSAYQETLTLTWNLIPGGSKGYSVSLSRGTNCVIYSDSLNAPVTAAQLATMTNYVSAVSSDYALIPATDSLSFQQNPIQHYFVTVENTDENLKPKNCEVEIINGYIVRVKKVEYTGQEVSADSAEKTIASYTLNVFCESLTTKLTYTVVISKILPKEELQILGSQAFVYGNNFLGLPSPESIILTAESKWQSTSYEWAYAIAGSNNYQPILDQSRFENGTKSLIINHNSPEWTNDARSITYRVYSNGTYDYKTVFKVAGGDSAYTAYLTNQNANVQVDEFGALKDPNQNVTTSIEVLKGSERYSAWVADGSIENDAINKHMNRYQIVIPENPPFSVVNGNQLVFNAAAFQDNDVTTYTIQLITWELTPLYLTFTINKVYQGVRGYTGEYGLSAVLTNDSEVIQCDSEGAPLLNAFFKTEKDESITYYVESELQVFKGADNITNNLLPGSLSDRLVDVEVVSRNVRINEPIITQTGYKVQVIGWDDSKEISDEGYVIFNCKIYTNTDKSTYSTLSKKFTLKKVKDGRTGDIATVYHLQVNSSAIAINSGDTLGFTPEKIEATTVVLGNESVSSSLPIIWSTLTSNDEVNLLPVSHDLEVYPSARIHILKPAEEEDEVVTEYDNIFQSVGVIVDKINKWIFLYSGEIQNEDFLTEGQKASLASPDYHFNRSAVCTDTGMEAYSLYSAIPVENPYLVTGSCIDATEQRINNKFTYQIEYYETGMTYLRVRMLSSRIATNARVLDEQTIVYLMKDWTGVNIIITPTVIVLPSNEFGTERDYTPAKAKISVLNGELDVTNKCYFELIDDVQGQKASLTGWVKDTNGDDWIDPETGRKEASSSMYVQLVQTSDGVFSGAVTIAVTYGVIIQRIQIPWVLQKQGLTGVPATYAGWWKSYNADTNTPQGGLYKKYQLRDDKYTVVKWYRDPSNKKAEDYYYYKTRLLPKGSEPIEFNNVEPGTAAAEGYWEEFGAEYESVATSFLFAEDAYINDLASARLFIGDHYQHDANGNEIMDANGFPVTEYDGWAIDGKIIRSRSTAPEYKFVSATKDIRTDENGDYFVDSNHSTVYASTYENYSDFWKAAPWKEHAHYEEKRYFADNPASPSIPNNIFYPATYLRSDGGIYSIYGTIGGWTLNETSISHSVNWGTGLRKVLGMGFTNVWGPQIVQEEGGQFAYLRLGDDTNYSLENGVETVQSKTGMAYSGLEILSEKEMQENYIDYISQEELDEYQEKDASGNDIGPELKKKKAEGTNYGTTEYEKRSVFAQSNYYEMENADGLGNKKTVYVGAELYYINPLQFGITGALYDKSNGTILKEFFHLGSYNTIAGWLFDDNAIYNGRQLSYTNSAISGIRPLGDNKIYKIFDQGMFLYSKKFKDTGYDSGIEVFGGNIYFGKDTSDAYQSSLYSDNQEVNYTVDENGNVIPEKSEAQKTIRETFHYLVGNESVFGKTTSTDSQGNQTEIDDKSKIIFDTNLMNPEYIIKLGYEEHQNTFGYVTGGGPIFRISRYYPDDVWTQEDYESGACTINQIGLAKPLNLYGWNSRGEYVDLFKVNKNGAELGGWRFSREGLYNRGKWSTEGASYKASGMYDFTMVSGAKSGLPSITIQADRTLAPPMLEWINIEELFPGTYMNYFNEAQGRNYVEGDKLYYATPMSADTSEAVLPEGIQYYLIVGIQESISVADSESRTMLRPFHPYEYATTSKSLNLNAVEINIDATGNVTLKENANLKTVNNSGDKLLWVEDTTLFQVKNYTVLRGSVYTCGKITAVASGNAGIKPIVAYTRDNSANVGIKKRLGTSQKVFLTEELAKSLGVVLPKQSNSVSFGVELHNVGSDMVDSFTTTRDVYFKLTHSDNLNDPLGLHNTIMSVDVNGAYIAGWNIAWDKFYRRGVAQIAKNKLGSLDREFGALYYNENTGKFDMTASELLKQAGGTYVINNVVIEAGKSAKIIKSIDSDAKEIQNYIDGNGVIHLTVQTSEGGTTNTYKYASTMSEVAIMASGEIHNYTFADNGAKFINWALYPTGEAIFANGGLKIGHKNGIPYIEFGESVDSNLSSADFEVIEINEFVTNGHVITTDSEGRRIELTGYNPMSSTYEYATFISSNMNQFVITTVDSGGAPTSLNEGTAKIGNPKIVILRLSTKYPSALYYQSMKGQVAMYQVPSGKESFNGIRGEMYTVIYNLEFYISEEAKQLYDPTQAAKVDKDKLSLHTKQVKINYNLDPNRIFADSNKERFISKEYPKSYAFENGSWVIKSNESYYDLTYDYTDICLKIQDEVIHGAHIQYEVKSNGEVVTTELENLLGTPTLINSESQNVGLILFNGTTDQIIARLTDYEKTIILNRYLTHNTVSNNVDIANLFRTIVDELRTQYQQAVSEQSIFPLYFYLKDQIDNDGSKIHSGYATVQLTYNGKNYKRNYYITTLEGGVNIQLVNDVLYVPVDVDGTVLSSYTSKISSAIQVDYQTKYENFIALRNIEVIPDNSLLMDSGDQTSGSLRSNGSNQVDFILNDKLTQEASIKFVQNYSMDADSGSDTVVNMEQRLLTYAQNNYIPYVDIAMGNTVYWEDLSEAEKQSKVNEANLEVLQYQAVLNTSYAEAFRIIIGSAYVDMQTETNLIIRPVIMGNAMSSYDNVSTDWVTDWKTKSTYLDSKRILTPKLFAGEVSDFGDMSGIMLGKFNAQYGGKTVEINGLVGVYNNREYLHLSENYCRLAGWVMTDSKLFNLYDKKTNEQNPDEGIELDSKLNHVRVYGTSRIESAIPQKGEVKMYFDKTSASWGIVGRGVYDTEYNYVYKDDYDSVKSDSAEEIFHLGSHNQIAGFTFTPNAISKEGMRFENLKKTTDAGNYYENRLIFFDPSLTFETVSNLEGYDQTLTSDELVAKYGSQSISYVKMYYQGGPQGVIDWGIQGISSKQQASMLVDENEYTELFHLGSYNHIAHWQFQNYYLTNGPLVMDAWKGVFGAYMSDLGTTGNRSQGTYAIDSAEYYNNAFAYHKAQELGFVWDNTANDYVPSNAQRSRVPNPSNYAWLGTREGDFYFGNGALSITRKKGSDIQIPQYLKNLVPLNDVRYSYTSGGAAFDFASDGEYTNELMYLTVRLNNIYKRLIGNTTTQQGMIINNNDVDHKVDPSGYDAYFVTSSTQFNGALFNGKTNRFYPSINFGTIELVQNNVVKQQSFNDPNLSFNDNASWAYESWYDDDGVHALKMWITTDESKFYAIYDEGLIRVYKMTVITNSSKVDKYGRGPCIQVESSYAAPMTGSGFNAKIANYAYIDGSNYTAPIAIIESYDTEGNKVYVRIPDSDISNHNLKAGDRIILRTCIEPQGVYWNPAEYRWATTAHRDNPNLDLGTRLLICDEFGDIMSSGIGRIIQNYVINPSNGQKQFVSGEGLQGVDYERGRDGNYIWTINFNYRATKDLLSVKDDAGLSVLDLIKTANDNADNASNAFRQTTNGITKVNNWLSALSVEVRTKLNELYQKVDNSIPDWIGDWDGQTVEINSTTIKAPNAIFGTGVTDTTSTTRSLGITVNSSTGVAATSGTQNWTFSGVLLGMAAPKEYTIFKKRGGTDYISYATYASKSAEERFDYAVDHYYWGKYSVKNGIKGLHNGKIIFELSQDVNMIANWYFDEHTLVKVNGDKFVRLFVDGGSEDANGKVTNPGSFGIEGGTLKTNKGTGVITTLNTSEIQSYAFQLGSTNQIGGWRFENNGLWKITGVLATQQFEGLQRYFNKASFVANYVRIVANGTDTGIEAGYYAAPSTFAYGDQFDETKVQYKIFKLGSENFIGNWLFSIECLYKFMEVETISTTSNAASSTDVNWTINSDGSGIASQHALGVLQLGKNNRIGYLYFPTTTLNDVPDIKSRLIHYLKSDLHSFPNGNQVININDYYSWYVETDGSFSFGHGAARFYNKSSDLSSNPQWVFSLGNDALVAQKSSNPNSSEWEIRFNIDKILSPEGTQYQFNGVGYDSFIAYLDAKDSYTYSQSKSYADTAASTAEKNAKDASDTKGSASNAESNAKKYADEIGRNASDEAKAAIPTWVSNGKSNTYIGPTEIAAPRAAFGTEFSANTWSGVLLGYVGGFNGNGVTTSNYHVNGGIAGYKDGTCTFRLDRDHMLIGGFSFDSDTLWTNASGDKSSVCEIFRRGVKDVVSNPNYTPWGDEAYSTDFFTDWYGYKNTTMITTGFSDSTSFYFEPGIYTPNGFANSTCAYFYQLGSFSFSADRIHSTSGLVISPTYSYSNHNNYVYGNFTAISSTVIESNGKIQLGRTDSYTRALLQIRHDSIELNNFGNNGYTDGQAFYVCSNVPSSKSTRGGSTSYYGLNTTYQGYAEFNVPVIFNSKVYVNGNELKATGLDDYSTLLEISTSGNYSISSNITRIIITASSGTVKLDLPSRTYTGVIFVTHQGQASVVVDDRFYKSDEAAVDSTYAYELPAGSHIFVDMDSYWCHYDCR